MICPISKDECSCVVICVSKKDWEIMNNAVGALTAFPKYGRCPICNTLVPTEKDEKCKKCK